MAGNALVWLCHCCAGVLPVVRQCAPPGGAGSAGGGLDGIPFCPVFGFEWRVGGVKFESTSDSLQFHSEPVLLWCGDISPAKKTFPGGSDNTSRSTTVSCNSPGVGRQNIIGRLPGADGEDGCYVVFGAHYDSVNWRDGFHSKAPGADDNGSGTATLLLVAKALAEVAKEKQPRCSIIFASFVGEEEGLLGSNHFVDHLVIPGKLGHFTGALILDQVGYSGSKEHKNQIILETSGDNAANGAIVDTLAKSADAAEPGELASYQVLPVVSTESKRGGTRFPHTFLGQSFFNGSRT